MNVNMKNRFKYLFHFSETQILISMSLVVGLGTAFSALIFIKLIEYFREVFFNYSEQVMTSLMGSFDYWIFIIPMAGGLLVGPIVYKFAVEARGHGVPEVLEAILKFLISYFL